MTLNCKGTLLDLATPKVMGILNCTPDSFYDGGKYNDDASILKQVEKMLTDGATFIDVGAYSSKPGADFVSETEELNRLLPVIELILKQFPETLLSIDTFRSTVAKKAIDLGAAMINDISAGGVDDKMMETVSKLGVPYCMMHMRGTPQTMQTLTQYDNLIKEVLFYFSEKISLAKSWGINDIVIDPGFGFAKTVDQNFKMLQNLSLFEMLELPILVGVSRKSMIYKILETNQINSLNGTTALHVVALQNGANILRVHDVKEAVECVKLIEKLKN